MEMVSLKTVAMVVGGIVAGMVVLSVASAFIITKKGGGCPLTRNNIRLPQDENSTSESYL